MAAFFFCVWSVGCLGVADEFPQPFNSGMGADEQPLGGEASAHGFRVPPGFSVQLFAQEPDVQNPVAMTWDGRGRLWVAEYYTYAERPLKFDLSLRDRVVILADTDGDGRADVRKVFCDNVQRLTSIEVGRGGVWLLSLPQLLFIPDRDRDDVPDGPPEVVLDGFWTSPENYHNCANGLRWGPDGWLYGRCGASSPGWIGPPDARQEDRVPIYGGLWRYHPTRRVFETLCHGTTNPWGHDWDAHGELFFTNTVTGHLFHLLPGAHYTRSATITPNRRVYEPINTQADHLHWDSGRGVNYREPTHAQLGGGHAHCGALIYLAEQWPAEYRGKLLTLNFHGRRFNVDRLERGANGFVACHDPDICFAEDEWFRGIDLSCGPEGAVYVLDWSDTGECHEHEGVHRLSGRVFRFSYGDAADQPPDLTRLSVEDLARLHTHANEWFVRQARLELATRDLTGADGRRAVAELRDLFHQPGAAVQNRLRALWTLYALEEIDRAELRALLDSADEHLRTWGLRLLTDFWPLDTVHGLPRATKETCDPELVSRLESLALNEPPGLMRLALASTLQRLPLECRPAIAAALASHGEDALDHDLPSLVWYGVSPLVDGHAASLIALATQGQYPLTRQWIARAIAEEPVQRAAELDALLQAATAGSGAVRADVLAGLSAGLAGRRKVEAPPSWEAFAASLEGAAPGVRQQVRHLAVVFGDGQALDEVRRLALDNRATLPTRRAALETLIEARPPDLQDLCQQLLRVRFLNTTALRGLTLFDDPAIGEQLARNYNSFHPTERAAVLETLVSRPAFAVALLDQMAAGRIPTSELTASQARQIRSYGNPTLAKRLSEVWGELRDSPEDKQQLISQLRQQLQNDVLAAADRQRGRAVFHAVCANCHRLFGSGGTIGPDLTGSGRHNLDYLLGNIVDPSAVVNKDYRMSIVQHADGRVLNGIIVSDDATRIVLQTPQEKLTILREDIEQVALTTLSAMPEGILQPLSAEQIRDLMAYLMSPGQVDLPPEFTLDAAAGSQE